MSFHNIPFRVRSRSGRRARSKSKTRSEHETETSQLEGRSKSRSTSRSRSSKARQTSRHSSRSSYSENSNEEIEPWTTCPPELAKASMPPGLAKQYETAGLEYHQPLPKGDFPHASYERRDRRNRRRRRLTKRQLYEQLLEVNPPPLGTSRDDDPDRAVESTSQRQQSTAHLVELLHMCMRKGDYARAERAFGILLRLHVDGSSLELRSDNFWGIGAEILMRLDRPIHASSREPMSLERVSRSRKRNRSSNNGAVWRYRFDNSDVEREAQREREKRREEKMQLEKAERCLPMPSPSAWTAVRTYYENLIIQYPQPKSSRPGQASASDFYLAMFETWIAHLQDMHDIEKENIAGLLGVRLRDSPGFGQFHGTEPGDPDNLEHISMTEEDNEELIDALDEARERQLGRASELVKRLDEILGSLSYSDDPVFVELRANVELWLADLCTPLHAQQTFRRLALADGSTAADTQDGFRDYLLSSESDSVLSKEDEVPTSAQRPVEDQGQTGDLQQSSSHLKRARELFAKVRELEQTMHLRIQ